MIFATPITVTGVGAAALTAQAWVLVDVATLNFRPLAPTRVPVPVKGVTGVRGRTAARTLHGVGAVGPGAVTGDRRRRDAGAAPEQRNRAGVGALEGDVRDLDDLLRRAAWLANVTCPTGFAVFEATAPAGIATPSVVTRAMAPIAITLRAVDTSVRVLRELRRILHEVPSD